MSYTNAERRGSRAPQSGLTDKAGFSLAGIALALMSISVIAGECQRREGSRQAILEAYKPGEEVKYYKGSVLVDRGVNRRYTPFVLYGQKNDDFMLSTTVYNDRQEVVINPLVVKTSADAGCITWLSWFSKQDEKLVYACADREDTVKYFWPLDGSTWGPGVPLTENTTKATVVEPLNLSNGSLRLQPEGSPQAILAASSTVR